MAESTPTTFRAIIVGAGPVGLYLAHALSKANIDYVVLEQSSSVIRYQGAGVLLYPQTLRLLDQIGLYEKAESIFVVNRMRNQTELLTSNGRVIKSSPLWSVLGERHAYPLAGLSRGQLIALLYENLPEKESRVKSGAAVRDIETHPKGVKVHLKDGSIEEGSILIGADGVHSKTRQIMQQQLAHTPPDTWPMTAHYHGLYGCFQPSHGFEPGTLYQSRGSGIVSQFIAGADRGHYAVLRPIPPTAEPKRYTTEDRDHLARELADIMVAPGVRFQDVWERTARDTAAMVNQEEGYCDRWHHGRVVLAGDAVHKATSVTGLGVNTGLGSAAVLANELCRALRSEPRDPGTGALEGAFARYQRIRGREASRLYTVGRGQIRGVTWATWADWVFDRFVSPWIGVDTVAGIFGNLIRRGQILEYVPFRDREVQEPWVHSPTA